MLFNSIKNSGKIGFKGNLTPDINLLLGEITGRYLITAKNQERVEKYLIKTKTPYEILGNTNNTGVLDLGFTKIRLRELNTIYQNSLANKAQ